MTPKTWFLYLYVGLWFGTWVLVFIYSWARHRLIKKVAPFFKNSDLHTQWIEANRGFWCLFGFGDVRRMSIVKANLNFLPPDLLRDYRRYVFMTKLVYALFEALILFTFLAYVIS